MIHLSEEVPTTISWLRYLKAAQVGDEVVVAAAADKIGRNLAFLSVTLSQKGTNNVLAKGKHTKYIGSS